MKSLNLNEEYRVLEQPNVLCYKVKFNKDTTLRAYIDSYSAEFFLYNKDLEKINVSGYTFELNANVEYYIVIPGLYRTYFDSSKFVTE